VGTVKDEEDKDEEAEAEDEEEDAKEEEDVKHSRTTYHLNHLGTIDLKMPTFHHSRNPSTIKNGYKQYISKMGALTVDCHTWVRDSGLPRGFVIAAGDVCRGWQAPIFVFARKRLSAGDAYRIFHQGHYLCWVCVCHGCR